MTSFWQRYRPWILLSLTVVLVFAIRLRLRDMPLERDEGEYAYAGQLMLQGVPPYKEAYNMKLPGTYAAYAVIMAVFGQTPSGIHIGVAFVNAATIVLVFLIGRRLLDDVTGVVAAVVYALMSNSPSVLGQAGHATHFVTFFAMAGSYVLLRITGEAKSRVDQGSPTSFPLESSRVKVSTLRSLRYLLFDPRSAVSYLFCGILFGLAFLMKQHGVFFGIFGGLYLLWCYIGNKKPRMHTDKHRYSRERPRQRSGSLQVRHSSTTPSSLRSSSSTATSSFILHPSSLLFYASGFLLPYLLTCLILWAAGVFPQFWFWTVSYASKYAVAISSQLAQQILRHITSVVLSSNSILLLLAVIGAIVMWWEERLDAARRWFVVGLLLCSAASVSPGFYFREHYFITLLPAIGLLGGVAVSRSSRVLRVDKTIELFTAIPILALFAIGCIVELAGNGTFWFALSPELAVQDTYHTTLFAQARKAGQFLRNSSAREARIAVVGSEPEIYFYAKRRAATGYIYAYPLMEEQPYAKTMQQKMISEIERKKPEYCVFTDDPSSWLATTNSAHQLSDWWQDYSEKQLNLLQTLPVKDAIQTSTEEVGLQVLTGNTAEQPKAENSEILVFKRK